MGLNLPTIMHHYHHCRSYVVYLPYYELEKKYGIFDSDLEKIVKNKYNVQKAKLKGLDKEALLKTLNNMNKVYKDFPQIENAIKEIRVIEHPYGGLNITPDIQDNKCIMEVSRNFYGDENIVKEQFENISDNQITNIELTYIKPNNFFTRQAGSDIISSNVVVKAWKVTIEQDATTTFVFVDFSTGNILGGDQVK